MTRCKKCLNPTSRPRIVFNEEGVCNACLWAERKKTINWGERRSELNTICDMYRLTDYPDVIVPMSGGKDGTYVAWKLKHEFDMHPLCVTFSPPIQTDIGRENLESFRNSGFQVLEIRPNPDVYRKLCKEMFIDQARSKFPFVIGIATAVAKLAVNMGIPFIVYGEEGETEYGGSDKFENQLFVDTDMLSIYHEDNDIVEQFGHLFPNDLPDLMWWDAPNSTLLSALRITWWSKWESWDDQLHRDLAIEKCGLKTADQIGTFTEGSQLDDVLQDLHMFECFIKCGTGRAAADCNLAIHAGRMTREEGLKIVNEIDGEYPWKYHERYLDFFKMTDSEFWNVIDEHVNWDLLKRGKEIKPYILKGNV